MTSVRRSSVALALRRFVKLFGAVVLLFFLFYTFFSSPFFRSFAVRSRMNIIDRVFFFFFSFLLLRFCIYSFLLFIT